MKAKPETFPIAVSKGSATVKIYRDQSKASGTYYRVSFYKGSKRERLNCTTLEEAKSEANAKAAQLARGDLDALQLTGRDRLVYGRALEAIRPLGIALDTAAHEYFEAKKLLAGHSLADAARLYMRHHGRKAAAKTVRDAVDEMIAAKTQKGVSGKYLEDLRYRLGKFAEAFKCNVGTIVPDDVRAYLDALKLAPRGFNNMLSMLKTFFAYCVNRGWLVSDSGLLHGIEKRREKSAPVEIFTPSEMAVLLNEASSELQPCLALAAFAGLRSEEILRLEWSDLERRPGYVEIAAAKAKTAARRLVPIVGNLTQWLANAPRGGSGSVWPHSKAYYFEAIRDTVARINREKSRKAAKFVWKPNALRHSFISYRLAEIQDVNRVALEAGNSPRMIFQHYRELCTSADAKTWFHLGPAAEVRVHPIRFIA
jgi:integrase